MTTNKLKNQKVINTIKIDEKIANDVIGTDDRVGDDFKWLGKWLLRGGHLGWNLNNKKGSSLTKIKRTANKNAFIYGHMIYTNWVVKR